jgi:acetylglutamate kinase
MADAEKNISDEELNVLLGKAGTLADALPYIRDFHGETIVIKYGGNAMIDEGLKRQVTQDIVLLHLIGLKPVVVHGGGPAISSLMARLGIEPKFVNGMRVTDSETMDVAEMVLAKIRGEIAAMLNQHGRLGVGLSGKDGGLFLCEKLVPERPSGGETVDYGFVGEITSVNPELIKVLDSGGFIPVISPIAVDASGQTYNVNADLAAAELARALKARKFVLLTNVRGVLRDPENPDSLIASIPLDEIEGLVADGTISGGMIPKTQACLRALDNGVRKAHILDGRLPHALLLELLTPAGVGTQITQPSA